MGTPNREPQQYSTYLNRNMGTLVGLLLVYSYYILGVPCFGVPSKVPFSTQVLKSPRVDMENARMCTGSFRKEEEVKIRPGLGFRV